MTSSDEDCLFCQIAAGDVPAEVVASNDDAVAFTDINPQAPLHVLVVPRVHQPNAAALARHEPGLVARLFTTAAEVVAGAGLEDYRTVFNTGPQAGQTVFHAHLHVLGGRDLQWPPG